MSNQVFAQDGTPVTFHWEFFWRQFTPREYVKWRKEETPFTRMLGESDQELRERIMETQDFENTELPEESDLRRTPRFFRNFSGASQTARAFRGEVFGGRDAKGTLYSVRRGTKFLTLAGNFMEHDRLITVKEEIDG